jgi:tetratricopeptide (TPR) repeat protein
MECPGPLTLFQYANGHLDRTQSERIASHVRTCPRCAEKVQATGNDGRSLADALEPREPMALETAEDVLRRLDLDLEFVDEADVEAAPAKPRAATVAPSARPTLPPPGGLRSKGLPPPPRKPTPMGSSLRSDPPRATTVGPPPSFGSGGTRVAPAPQPPASSGDNTVRAPAPTRPPSPPPSKPAAAAPPVPVVRTTGSSDSKSAPVVDATRSSRKWLYASVVVFALVGIGGAGALILYPRLTGEELRWASVVAVFDKNADSTTKASDAPSQLEPEEEEKVDAKKVDAKTPEADANVDDANVDDAKIDDAKIDDAKIDDAKADDAKADAPLPDDANDVDAKDVEDAPPAEETKLAVEETKQPAEAAPPPPEPDAKQPAEAAPPPEPADDSKLAAADVDKPAEPPAETPEPATEIAPPPKPAVEPTPVAPARTPLYSEPVGSRDPEEAIDLARRGALALRKSDVGAAEAMFLRALAHDPRNATALGGLAALHFGQGRHRTSLKFATKAVNAAPQDADLRILLGDAYLETLGYANARREYEKAGALGHRSAPARLARLQERLAAK